MKVRVGFVTNSSSTSFIVAFDKPMNRWHAEELVSDLFKDTEFRRSLGGVDCDKQFGIDGYDAYMVLVEALGAELSSCIEEYGELVETIEDMRKHWIPSEWVTGEKTIADIGELEKFWESNKDKYIYRFDVEDNTYTGWVLERARLLDQLPCLRLWCH